MAQRIEQLAERYNLRVPEFKGEQVETARTTYEQRRAAFEKWGAERKATLTEKQKAATQKASQARAAIEKQKAIRRPFTRLKTTPEQAGVRARQVAERQQKVVETKTAGAEKGRETFYSAQEAFEKEFAERRKSVTGAYDIYTSAHKSAQQEYARQVGLFDAKLSERMRGRTIGGVGATGTAYYTKEGGVSIAPELAEKAPEKYGKITFKAQTGKSISVTAPDVPAPEPKKEVPRYKYPSAAETLTAKFKDAPAKARRELTVGSAEIAPMFRGTKPKPEPLASFAAEQTGKGTALRETYETSEVIYPIQQYGGWFIEPTVKAGEKAVTKLWEGTEPERKLTVRASGTVGEKLFEGATAAALTGVKLGRGEEFKTDAFFTSAEMKRIEQMGEVGRFTGQIAPLFAIAIAEPTLYGEAYFVSYALAADTPAQAAVSVGTGLVIGTTMETARTGGAAIKTALGTGRAGKAFEKGKSFVGDYLIHGFMGLETARAGLELSPLIQSGQYKEAQKRGEQIAAEFGGVMLGAQYGGAFATEALAPVRGKITIAEAKQGMTKAEAARFEKYLKEASGVYGVQPKVKEPKFSEVKNLSQKAAKELDKFTLLKENLDMKLGGSVAQRAQIYGEGERPSDVDFYMKYPIEKARAFYTQAKAAGVKRISKIEKSKKGGIREAEITIEGSKSIEFKDERQLWQNIGSVRGVFELPGASIVRAPSGRKMLRISTQLKRKAIGGFIDKRPKDIRHFDQILRSLKQTELIQLGIKELPPTAPPRPNALSAPLKPRRGKPFKERDIVAEVFGKPKLPKGLKPKKPKKPKRPAQEYPYADDLYRAYPAAYPKGYGYPSYPSAAYPAPYKAPKYPGYKTAPYKIPKYATQKYKIKIIPKKHPGTYPKTYPKTYPGKYPVPIPVPTYVPITTPDPYPGTHPGKYPGPYPRKYTYTTKILTVPSFAKTTIPKPMLGLPKTSLKKKPLTDKRQAYNVMVRERGTRVKGKFKSGAFVKVNRVPLTESSALGLGSLVADKTVSRTFRLKKTGGKPKEKNFGVWNMLAHKFRPIVRKKQKWQLNPFVEKTGYAIDSSGEFKGITVKGWKAARKKRSGFNTMGFLITKPKQKRRRKR